MAFYRLLQQAVDIRDTNDKDHNTADYVGGWLYDAITYYGNSVPNYNTLRNNATTIRNATGNAVNTAKRIGNWCVLAMDSLGLRPNHRNLFYDLHRRSVIIRDEYNDMANTRRLGQWMVDFLTYIDYEGDTPMEDIFIASVQVTAGNAIAIPFDYFQGTINWGDGTTEEITTPTRFPLHTYATAGTYQLWAAGEATTFASELTGITGVPAANSSAVTRWRTAVRLIESWGYMGPNMVRAANALRGTTNLSSVPSGGPKKLLLNVTNCSGFFYGSGISALPSTMFNWAPKVLDMSACLRDTTKLTGTIHRDFLAYMPNLQNISEMCMNSTIGGIPVGFLRNNPSITLMAGTWTNCVNVVTLPADYFSYQQISISGGAAGGLYRHFYGCRFPSIPSGFMTGLKNKCAYMAEMFASNTALTSGLQQGAGFFEGMRGSPMQLMTGMFSGCTSLSNVGYDLLQPLNPYFTGTTPIVSFLANCAITAVDARMWQNMAPIVTNVSNFYEGNPITDAGLPDDVFYYIASQLTQLTGVFRNTLITHVHRSTFATLPNLTVFDSPFNGPGIVQLPTNMFNIASASKITNANNLLRYLPNLDPTLVPAQLIYPLVNLETLMYGFATGALQANSIHPLFLSQNTKLRRIDNLCDNNNVGRGVKPWDLPEAFFANCLELTNVSSVFSHWQQSITPDTSVTIPEHFKYHQKIENFTSAYNNIIYTKNTPRGYNGYRLWELAGKPGLPATVTGTQCFRNWNASPEYAQIPTTWK